MTEPTTIVGAVYKSATFGACIQASDVPGMLRDARKAMKPYKAARTCYGDAKDYVVNTLKNNGHLTDEGAQQMACVLLWAFCVGSPLAHSFEINACEGGHMFVWEITGEVPGYVNFRIIAGEAEIHPLAHLFPDPRTVRTAGNA
jgi:hypothetical protein